MRARDGAPPAYRRDGAAVVGAMSAFQLQVILMTKPKTARKPLSSTKRKKTSKSSNNKSRRSSTAARLVLGRESVRKPNGRSESIPNPDLQIRQTGRPNSKQNRLIELLQKQSGATIDTMMQLTGWKQHSVRGFLAGVVRKKLRLDLIAEPNESGRIYRITDRLADTKSIESA